jgi:flagellar operon protein
MSGVDRIGPIPTKPEAPAQPARREESGFKEIWTEACEKHQLKFSRHAIERLEGRNLALGSAEMERLGSAVARAGEKGARESLVLLDELAFVVSVRNRTVITALQPSKEGVFTSIDSAVIA